jgi:hypothetical protein
MEGEGRKTTTITVFRATKDRFLEEIVGAPKRFKNADLALTALMDNFVNKDKAKPTVEESGDGVQSS